MNSLLPVAWGNVFICVHYSEMIPRVHRSRSHGGFDKAGFGYRLCWRFRLDVVALPIDKAAAEGYCIRREEFSPVL
jgi:hypothetical protein